MPQNATSKKRRTARGDHDLGTKLLTDQKLHVATVATLKDGVASFGMVNSAGRFELNVRYANTDLCSLGCTLIMELNALLLFLKRWESMPPVNVHVSPELFERFSLGRDMSPRGCEVHMHNDVLGCATMAWYKAWANGDVLDRFGALDEPWAHLRRSLVDMDETIRQQHRDGEADLRPSVRSAVGDMLEKIQDGLRARSAA